MSKTDLFLELAKPDKKGISRWVFVKEFVKKYADLRLGNGGSWCRKNSALAQKYNIEFDKSKTPGNSIDAIRLCGFNKEKVFKQNIRADIKQKLQKKRCVMLGVVGFSENTKIEIDHKDGRKNDWRISDMKTQKIDDFQPLCKAANDVKRQICKECKLTNKRWDAKNISGNPLSFYEGNANYEPELGCRGCYQYDPVEYRMRCVILIAEEAAKHTAEFVVRKFYQDEK